MSTSSAKSTPRRKRRSKAQIEADKQAVMVEDAARLSAMMAAAPMDGDEAFAPPKFLSDPLLAAAQAVWRDLAPLLRSRALVGPRDRVMFASLCYWTGEFVTALDDIARNGYAIIGKSHAGHVRPWKNPSVDRRDTAYDYMLELSKRFGLTTLDRHQLFKRYEPAADDDDALPFAAAVSGDDLAGDASDDDDPNVVRSAPAWDDEPPARPN